MRGRKFAGSVYAPASAFRDIHAAIFNVDTAIVSGSGSGVASVNGMTGTAIVSASPLGLASGATSGAYGDLTGRPALGPLSGLSPTGTASGSTYLRRGGARASIPTATPPVSSVAGRTGTIVLTTDIGGLATVAKTGAYGDLSSKPTLAAVASSGSYLDLTNRPTPVASVPGRTGSVVLTTADIGGIAPLASSSDYNDPANRPTLGSIASHEASDYLMPTGDGSGLTGLTGSQISGPIAGRAGTVATVAGLIAEGSNVTIGGTGTAASPLMIAAAGGGSSGPTDQLKAAAVHGTPFLVAVGTASSPDDGGAGNDDPSNGPAFYLTNNTLNNRRVCLIGSGQVGDATRFGLRFVLGLPLPIFDAVSADVKSISPFLIGGPDSSVGMGLDATATAGDIHAQLHVKAGVAGRTVLAVQGNAGLAFAVLDSMGNVLGSIGPKGKVYPGLLSDAQASDGALYLSLDHHDANFAPMLCRKDFSGNVTIIG